MQRWPAVPMAAKARRAGSDRDRPRARRSRRCCRRVPESPGRSGGDLGPDDRPMRVEPVADTTGTRAVVDQRLADRRAADHDARSAGASGRTPRARSNSARRQRGQRRFLRRLPHHGVAADQRQRRVPGPDGDREVEGGNDADAQRPPGLIIRWSGRSEAMVRP